MSPVTARKALAMSDDRGCREPVMGGLSIPALALPNTTKERHE